MKADKWVLVPLGHQMTVGGNNFWPAARDLPDINQMTLRVLSFTYTGEKKGTIRRIKMLYKVGVFMKAPATNDFLRASADVSSILMGQS